MLVEPPQLVLIATVDAAVRVELARLVARRGMTALACFDGAAAIAAAHAEHPHLQGAILDSQLPTLSAEHVVQALTSELRDVATLVLADDRSPHQPPGTHLAPDELARIDTWLDALAPPPLLAAHRS